VWRETERFQKETIALIEQEHLRITERARLLHKREVEHNKRECSIKRREVIQIAIERDGEQMARESVISDRESVLNERELTQTRWLEWERMKWAKEQMDRVNVHEEVAETVCERTNVVVQERDTKGDKAEQGKSGANSRLRSRSNKAQATSGHRKNATRKRRCYLCRQLNHIARYCKSKGKQPQGNGQQVL
jgi:hypothetical protein